MNISKQNLISMVEKLLPEMKEMCEADAEVLIFHQDAFAADLQPQELTLLGMAIKYIGLSGKTIHIIGKNGETVKNSNKKEEII